MNRAYRLHVNSQYRIQLEKGFRVQFIVILRPDKYVVLNLLAVFHVKQFGK